MLPSFSLLICLLIHLLEDKTFFGLLFLSFTVGFSAPSCQLCIRCLIRVEWASLVAQLVKNPPAIVGDLGSIPGLGSSPGEGKEYPLQYSGLESSMDCVVNGVTKSWTRLSDFHFTSCIEWMHTSVIALIVLYLIVLYIFLLQLTVSFTFCICIFLHVYIAE